ncbi:nicotinate phosphoribosyltransferase [Hoylesella oralis ATCC 33269]|uniref:Nicotinate phosphoribosyltransferase n=1 Tax=Hoylesella oralis ATCC 33269 TaxID=873533 RepID=E7RMN2_9BACT|nr:nicotinate phosphoribosyltransferase [Hoylesella oralis]EFZ38013.1 nicotinate phosphoribosyltransferase [Hoylesella oralis ATCC 33269]EPH16379.1 nicotinate phosphoribosyltransferase [Hoylesella oralis HGA0225]SHF40746.1 nicotinate phosphoribosyltransferase [Hoylesella oralis]
MRQIINHFTDNDAYTFSCQYYVLQTYPRAEVEYTFFDRNKTRYPKGFGELVKEQLGLMPHVMITSEEIAFMKRKMYYLPEWYFTFLRGYRFNPHEVSVSQDEEGHLDISVRGKWYSTIMWEMPILSIVSELMHTLRGEIERYDPKNEHERAIRKTKEILRNGIVLGDMGTRRRLSFDHHDMVIRTMKEVYEQEGYDEDGVHYPWTGRFTGTSNVYFAMKYGLTPIGTMSHQLIEFEENVSGVFECNFNVMRKFSDVYDGDNGIYLYDCFGDRVFFNNLSKRMAMMFVGLRVDSGIEEEQTEKIIEKYKSLGIDPSTKQVVFSNGLNIKRAIELHRFVDGRMQDSYGMGTFLTCDVENCEPMNIVVKLTRSRITENREWHDCVKLSCDKGKTLGNPEKCAYLLKQIG